VPSHLVLLDLFILITRPELINSDIIKMCRSTTDVTLTGEATSDPQCTVSFTVTWCGRMWSKICGDISQEASRIGGTVQTIFSNSSSLGFLDNLTGKAMPLQAWRGPEGCRRF
jgi:hypothetical protein